MKKFRFLIIFSAIIMFMAGFNAHAASENKMTYKMNLKEDAMYVDVKIETEHTGFKFGIDVPDGAEVYDVEGKSLRDDFLSGTKYIFDFNGGDKEVSYKIKGLPKAFKRADGFVFGLYRSFNTHINTIEIAYESVYFDEPVYELFTSKGLNATFEDGKTGLYEIDEPIDIAIGIKYPKNEFVNAPYEDMDYDDYRNDELMRTQITRIDKPGISELVLKGLIAVALLAFIIVGFLMTKNQRFRNKFRIKKKYEEKEKSGKTFDLKDLDEYIYLIYQFYDTKEDKVASYLGVDEADKLVEKKLNASYENLLKKGYIEKEDSDYSVSLTKKGRLKLEEILIKKEYLLGQDDISDEEEKFLRLFR